jgi:hypothetical protein
MKPRACFVAFFVFVALFGKLAMASPTRACVAGKDYLGMVARDYTLELTVQGKRHIANGRASFAVGFDFEGFVRLYLRDGSRWTLSTPASSDPSDDLGGCEISFV